MVDAHATTTEDEKTEKLRSAVNSALPSLERWRINSSDLGVEDDHRWIGRGGYAEVYKATLLGGPVAIKNFRTAGNLTKRVEAASTLLREVKLVGAILHQNIVEILGFHLSPDLEDAWLVTAWQANGVATAYIAATQPSLERRLELATDTAKGLAFLHSLEPPVCHGDIKPDNALVGDDGVVRISDLGLAETLDDVGTGLTTSRVANGLSFVYSSPERLRGQPRSREADVWAWGCLLLEIVEDQKPYEGLNFTGPCVQAIMNGTPPAKLEVGKNLDIAIELTQGCWDPLPSDRITMAECEERLTSPQGRPETAVVVRKSPSQFSGQSPYKWLDWSSVIAVCMEFSIGFGGRGVSATGGQQLRDPRGVVTKAHNPGQTVYDRASRKMTKVVTTSNPRGIGPVLQEYGTFSGQGGRPIDPWQRLHNRTRRNVTYTRTVISEGVVGSRVWQVVITHVITGQKWVVNRGTIAQARSVGAEIAYKELFQQGENGALRVKGRL